LPSRRGAGLRVGATQQSLYHASPSNSVANTRSSQGLATCNPISVTAQVAPRRTARTVACSHVRWTVRVGHLAGVGDAPGRHRARMARRLSRARIMLIVSCKSVIYDRNYDQGDFRVTRNTQATVDQAVIELEAISPSSGAKRGVRTSTSPVRRDRRGGVDPLRNLLQR